MDTRGQQQIAAGIGMGMHLPVTSGRRQEVQLLLCFVLTPVWITHLPSACSLQGYHGGIHDNLASNI